ncbi:ABC transporter protein [Candidatus Defluviicoccus seviourii]|uniref:ABC transporter protein n=1 Tax=Candidatus Defluviicoccus seviourii TaxID=2565273 RepID=A0A564WD66_9PROT|nr:ABC transporter protein [Candidatus Defluviicoccus seviourii]
MIAILRIFFREKVANPWLVLACLLLAGLAGGIGIGSLFPLVSIVTDPAAGTASPMGRIVVESLAFVGLAPDLGPIVAIFVGGMVLKSLFTLAAMRYVAYASAMVITELRAKLLRVLLDAEWSHFITQPVGIIANAVSLETTRSGRLYTMAATFLANGIQALIFIVVSLIVSWKLSLMAIAFGVGMAAALHYLVRQAKEAGRRETKRSRELLTFITDAFNSIKPLKAMDKQGHFAQLCESKNQALNQALRKQIYSQEARRNLEEIITVVCLGAAFYAAVTVWGYPPAEVLIVGVLLSQTTRNIGRIQDNLQKAVVNQSPYRAVRKLIATASAAEEHTGGTLPAKFENGCSFEHVSFAYPQREVLKDVSLAIAARRTTVLTGPSGSGKTTLTDLLAGLYRPQAGRILVDGVPLDEIDLRQWRQSIGYVPQELILFHDSILANVTLGDPRLSLADVRRALEAAGAWAFVEALPEGVNSSVGEKGFKLSGGQRQRIALARALATRPKLLILDEVTSALDPATEQDLCQRLKRIAREVTIVAVTHRPAFLEIADTVYRVENGSVYLGEAAHPSPPAVEYAGSDTPQGERPRVSG